MDCSLYRFLKQRIQRIWHIVGVNAAFNLSAFRCDRFCRSLIVCWRHPTAASTAREKRKRESLATMKSAIDLVSRYECTGKSFPHLHDHLILTNPNRRIVRPVQHHRGVMMQDGRNAILSDEKSMKDGGKIMWWTKDIETKKIFPGIFVTQLSPLL